MTAPTIEQVAAKRGIQTWLQGLGVDLLVAVALVVATSIVPAMESWEAVAASWPLWLLMITRSAIQAVASWALRRWADPSGTEIAEGRRP